MIYDAGTVIDDNNDKGLASQKVITTVFVRANRRWRHMQREKEWILMLHYFEGKKLIVT